MNIFNQVFLRMTLLGNPLFRKAGVHIPKMKAILKAKLEMDDRRPATFQQMSNRKSGTPVNRATLITMLVSALMGFLLLITFSVSAEPVTRMTFYYSFLLLLLTATLISDFTTVLIDVRDNQVILPRPVNDRTILAARLLHIAIHLMKIVLPMILPGAILVFTQYPAHHMAVFLLVTALLTIFAIVFVNIIYLLILRFTSPRRFQSLISYLQIFIAIALYGSFQLLPRLMRKLELQNPDISLVNGIEFYPVYWFAEAWWTLSVWEAKTTGIILTLLAFAFPMAALWLMVRYLGPAFSKKLALGGSQQTGRKRKYKSGLLLSRISLLFARKGNERAGFLFAWKISSRSREFRMKVYPTIGYLIVIAFMMLAGNETLNLEAIRNQTGSGKMFIVTSHYFVILLLTTAISQMAYSDRYRAAWIFFSSPIRMPGEIIAGSFKAVFVKYYLPFVLVVSGICISLAGWTVIPNILLAVFNSALIGLIAHYSFARIFPFSSPQQGSSQAGGFIRNLLVLVIAFGLGIIHVLIYAILPVVIILMLLSLTACWLLLSAIRNTTWNVLLDKYRDE